MKTKKPMWLAIAGIIGCGLCAVPLVIPFAASALGISILGFSIGSILIGILPIILAMTLAAVYFSRKKKHLESESAE